MKKIFISYRRADSENVCGRIYDRLVANFGKDAVFKDVDSIRPGEDWQRKIDDAIKQSGVQLVVIGPRWLSIEDEPGQRRLDNPKDRVRYEIRTALDRKIEIIPLMVEGANAPHEEQLPADLQKLARKNGVPVRADPDFENDMRRVMQEIEKHVPRLKQPIAPPPPPPVRPVATSVSTPPWSQSAPIRVSKQLPTPGGTGPGLRWLYALIGLIIAGVLIAAIGSQLVPKLAPGVPPRNVTNAMILAPVVAKLQQCASEAVASPANCPQSDTHSSDSTLLNQYASGIVWTLHGDPTAGARISYTGQNQWSVLGAFVMTVKWSNSGGSFLDLVKQGYQATVKWDGHQTALAGAISGSDTPDSSVQVARPKSATDAAVQQAGRALFGMCAAVTTVAPPLTCPQPTGGTLGSPSSVRYAFQPDPVQSAAITYDNSSGIIHLVGNYAMTMTATYDYGSQPFSQNGNYDTSLTLDNGVLTVIYASYS